MREPRPDAEAGAADELRRWGAATLAENPVVDAFIEEPPAPWRMRFRGEDKDVSTIYFTLAQRSLRYETFFTPDPEDDREACFAYLLGRNADMRLLRFYVGEERAIFLGGSTQVQHVDAELLDAVLGSFYEAIERSFRTVLRIGFARRMSR